MSTGTPIYAALLRDTAMRSDLDDGLGVALATLGGRHDINIATYVASRPDLDDATAAAVAADRSAEVRIRWLANPAIGDERFAAALADEDRVDVLVAAVDCIWDLCDDATAVARTEALTAAAPLEALVKIVASRYSSEARRIALAAASAPTSAAPLDDEALDAFRRRLDTAPHLRDLALSTVTHPELVAQVVAVARPGMLDERFDDLWSILLGGVDDPCCDTAVVLDAAAGLLAHATDPHAAAEQIYATAARVVDADPSVRGVFAHIAHNAALVAELTVAARSDRSDDHARVVEVLTESNAQRRSRLDDDLDTIVSTLLANPTVSDTHLRRIALDAKSSGRWSRMPLSAALSARTWSVDDALALSRTHPDVAVDLAAEHVTLDTFANVSAPHLQALCSRRLLAALADPAVAELCAEAFDQFDGTLGELLAALSSAYATT